MEIGLANLILNINIILGCVSLLLNTYVLVVLITRERKYRKPKGGHLRGTKERS